MTKEHIELIDNIAQELGLQYYHCLSLNCERQHYVRASCHHPYFIVCGTTRQEILAEIKGALKQWKQGVEAVRTLQTAVLSEVEGKLTKAMYPSKQDWLEYLEKLGLMNFCVIGNAVCVTVEGCSANLFLGRTWTDGKDAIDKMLKDAVEKLDRGAAEKKKRAEKLELIRDKNNDL